MESVPGAGSIPTRASKIILCLTGKNAVRLAVWCLLPIARDGAQDWDIGERAATAISGAAGQRLTLSFEQRGRYEDRTGTTLGIL